MAVSTWITATVLLFALVVTAYTLTPAYFQIVEALNQTARENFQMPGQTNSTLNLTVTVMRFNWSWVIAILCIAIMAWAYIASQRRERESYEY